VAWLGQHDCFWQACTLSDSTSLQEWDSRITHVTRSKQEKEEPTIFNRLSFIIQPVQKKKQILVILEQTYEIGPNI